jgi:signal transduction histidine kinase
VDAIASALDALFERSRNELARSRRFAADAAHELRTPLAKLRAEIELVAEELPADSTEQEALTGVVARVDELGRLVDRLLLLASPEETVRSDTLTSLAVVVETVVEDLSASEAKRVSVTLDADGLVTGDEAVLRSLVANAIDNALKYSDGEVRARVSRDGSDVVVRVDDDGPGLDPESRERAFEPFYRGAKERGQAGHGVGLALIAHVVSAHGGTARFLDGDGGARLELRLPRRDA